MKLSPGRRDTLITFQKRTRTKSSSGALVTEGWENLPANPTEWAEVQDMLPSRGEQIADGIDIARRPVRIRTLFRDDITSDMRIVYEDRTVEIIGGPAELGRREGLEMVCESYSTEGDRP